MRLLSLALLLASTIWLTQPAVAAPCDSRPTTLRAGQTVETIAQVNARSAPGFNGRIIAGLRVGDRLTIIDDAACVNGVTWWPVAGAVDGWVADSTQGVNYMRAIDVAAAPFAGELEYALDEAASDRTSSDRCPPLIGTVAVNFADVDTTQASEASTAFFVDTGFAVPPPTLCFPSVRLGTLAVTAPDGTTREPAVLPVAGSPDYVQATLPPFALLQNGTWTLSIEGYSVGIAVIGPFGPLLTGRLDGDAQQFLAAGFAQNERVAVISESESGLVQRTLNVDANGVFGGTIGAGEQLIAAVGESGLIALPPEVNDVLFGGQTNAVESDTQLIAALWGAEAAGLPTPEPQVTPTTPPECYYVVRSGDTLTRIAQRRGVSLQDVLDANPQITNPQVIRTGTRIILPGCVASDSP